MTSLIRRTLVTLLLVHILILPGTSQVHPSGSANAPPYLDPDLPLEHRVNDLVSRMTLDEKAGQTLYNAPAIPRLQIPEYNWWGEALHGVARAGKATVFPQAIGLAATWDAPLLQRVATVISDEARAKYHHSVRHGRRGIYEGLTFWSPNINIFRDPRWGRGMETYGEDPYLTGRLGVAFVKGMQGDHPTYLKTVATPKHFAVHSGPEPDRHVFDAIVDERDLRETYLPAFRATVVEANAQSIMCAYNRFRGNPCCGSNELLERILRREWGFSGYVVSDCWAIMDFYTFHKVDQTAPQAAARALLSGTDLNCGVTYDSLAVAVRQGLVSEALVDTAVKRLFRARFKLGMFDPDDRVPYARIPISTNDSKKHRQLALEAAQKSIVLLKNEKDLLPFRNDVRSIAVIGPNAHDVDLLLGNYNGVPSEPVTPLEGLRKKAPRGVSIFYAQGCELAKDIPAFELVPPAVLFTEQKGKRTPGLFGEYFNNHTLEGKPSVQRVDRSIDFNWWEDSPARGVRPDSFSVRWSGVLVPPTSGRYTLGVRAFGGARLWLDDSLLFGESDRHSVMTQWKFVHLEGKKPYNIRLEYWDRRADASAQLVWSLPKPNLKDEALAVAGRADVVVMMLGLSPRLEGEEMTVEVPGFKGGDRVDLGLPREQEELLRAIVATKKPVVLVLLSGSAVAATWAAENVPAILEVWYPGQAAGSALADVLFGNVNPGGRLPVTFYKSAEQLPPFSNYNMEGKTYRYFRGEPLYPFGHGLSYTRFEYTNLRIPASVRAGEQIKISADVENTGARMGDEVVQLYVTQVGASVPVPVRSLQGFQRLALKPGERRTVSFVLTPRQISLINNQAKRVVEPGIIEISVGGKQPGFKGIADAWTSGVLTTRLTVTGFPIEVSEKEN